jgi:N,N-dimethylformamidase
MLIGYVSDERYAALADVLLEFTNLRGESWEVRSRASGSVHADLPADEYLITLCKPGYGSKRVRMAPDPSRPYHFRLLADGLLGYAWPRCVRAGEQSEFRIHSSEPYRLDLWRYGWDKEFICGLGWHDEHGPRATMQITPDNDYTQTGVGWNRVGYCSPSHKQLVTAPARSGLYYFHATTRSGAAFSFPWVVAPKQPEAPVAVLASDITWNAYNNFGGRSNYIHADACPPTPTVNSRAELIRYVDPQPRTWESASYAPLSFERPQPINHIDLAEKIVDPIEGRSACHVAPAEWRLLGWLEREGFAYDLYSETQLHRGVLNLSHYRVLILSTHPEYWTRQMYEQVKAWVFEARGRLMYLGGNGLDCEVELRDDDTMVVYNGTPHTRQAMESRFAVRHESAAKLLGMVCTPAGIMTAAPYRVLHAGHWAFAGTGLADGDHFGERSLHMRCPGGASGHETDKISSSAPPHMDHLAKGLNPDSGGADMIFYRTPNGGAVFSVGSVCYPSSLPVDLHVSRITANVLRRLLE